jgi:hypothetical protein
LPVGKRCCPHCHCRYPALKRWQLAAAAALSVGAAGCTDRSLNRDPGSVHQVDDLSESVVDASQLDSNGFGPVPAYGPGMVFQDLSGPTDGGAD